MIPVSDLRKGNFIKTEYGILPVHAIVFDSIQVKGKDGRILWAREILGVVLSKKILCDMGFEKRGNELSNGVTCLEEFKDGICYSAGEGLPLSAPVHFAHELQNLHYWIEKQELELNT